MRMDDNKEKFLKYLEEWKEKRIKEMEENPEKFKPQYPYELFGIECGDGWKHLYQPIIDYIMKYNDGKEDKDKIEIHQIKEKFGGLRIYLSSYTEELREMIDEAEKESYNTCEVCGKPIEKPIYEHYWVYAECEDCHRKWKEEKEKKMAEAYEKLKNKK